MNTDESHWNYLVGLTMNDYFINADQSSFLDILIYFYIWQL